MNPWKTCYNLELKNTDKLKPEILKIVCLEDNKIFIVLKLIITLNLEIMFQSFNIQLQ